MEKVQRKVRVKAFGVTKEILGAREITVELDGQTVADLRTNLLSRYRELAGLKSLLIAVNNAYAEEEFVLNNTDEVALIPPVSGG